MATLLELVTEFCERTGLPVPAAVVDNTDERYRQIKALLQEAGNALAIRADWQRLRMETVHTTISGENQGNIFTLTAGGLTPFRKFADEILWDRTDQLPIVPMTGQEWQRLKGTVGHLAYRYRYRLWNYNLMLTPEAPAGHELAFEWMSRWWIQDAGGAIKETFTADSDSFLLERELLKLALRWRWKKEKGLEYAEDFREYELRLLETAGQDTPKGTLQQDLRGLQIRPGIFVPEGNWSLP